MALVHIRDLTKDYPAGEATIRALDGIDLDITAGTLTVVLGPSGSGKSTALNLLGGMDRASSGSILFDGDEVVTKTDKELTAYRRDRIGFVFQFYNLIGSLTALENVALAAQLHGTADAAAAALDHVGLSARADNFPGQLSGGEMQRVAIARALARQPRLLLCDEPTGALDSETGRMVLAHLQRITRELGTAVVVVTHNAAIASAADDVIRLHDGRLAETVHNANPIAMDEVTW